jgi:AcrR family transcriptional regulator
MKTRDKIVRCALRELERSGLHDFSLRAVGSAAGLSATAVYRHFEDKQHLLKAVGEEAFETYRQRMAAIPDGPLERWFGGVARAYLAFSLDDRERFDACFIARTSVERVYPRDFRAGRSPVIAMIVRRIEQAQAAGRMKPADPVELAMLLWAQVHGFAMLHRAERFSMGRRAFFALCDRGVQRIFDGVMFPSTSTLSRPRARK